VSNKKTNRQVIEIVFNAIMNKAFNVGIRRRMVAVNKLKNAILKSIFEKQEQIKNKHCK
jgi:hypothetical protein